MKRPLLIVIIFLIFTSVFSQNGRSVKRGIAYGNLSETDMEAISGGISWWYNWYHQPESGVANVYESYEMDFVPMTWNNGFNEKELRAFYTAHPNAKYLLGFNEPDFSAQANMKPSQVAVAWPRLEAIAADFDLKIVGPAVNWCGDCVSEGGVVFTNPYTYLDTFFSICPDCQIDYIAVHNYMCYTGALSSFVDGFKKYGKKIWLTEYACWNQANITLSMQKNLMKGSIDYLENDTMVFRYSWFTGNRSGAYPYLDIFAPQAGKLTELGQFYVSYKAFVPDTNYYIPVPDRIEAEHFSAMSGVSTETVSDFDGVDDVGWIDAKEWMVYNIDIPFKDKYYVYFRVSSNASTSIILKVDEQNTDTLKVPSSGGWQNWKTLGIQTVLPVGKHKLMIYAPTGNFNLNWIRISDHENNVPILFAGADQIITLPENVATLVGTGNDEDNDLLQYKWTKVSGPSSYVLDEPNSATTNVSGLVKGRYTFNLTVSDSTEIASDRVIVDVVFPVGIEDPEPVSARIYPNPVVNTLYFRNIGNTDKTEVSLTDPSGRKIFIKTFFEGINILEMDVSSLKPGFYFLKVKGNSVVYYDTFIKM